MHAAERHQSAHPYAAQLTGPLFEQWYLLHHRLVRVVTNHRGLADQVRHFLYYARLLAEYSYDQPFQLPRGMPEDILWQVGQHLHRPTALSCFLFQTQPGEPFPPEPAQPRPDTVEWEEISGVRGPQEADWREGSLRFCEYQAYPGVSSRISSVLDKADLHATIFVEDVEKCAPWFAMRHVFYMAIGAMLHYDGYEIVHAGAIALDGAGILLVGSPGSGKSTLVLSCLQADMRLLADDVLFLAKVDDAVRAYAFPEDIGVRSGSLELLGQHTYMQTLTEDRRSKRYIDVQQYFREQVVSSCPVRLMLFLHAKKRSVEFRAEQLSPIQAVTWLMQEYISRQKAQEGTADTLFDIFSDMAAQAPSYRLWLAPDARANAAHVRALLEHHV
jgi:hypothetical protein